jgi:tyrosine-protein phosphatase YwqE
VFSFFSSTGITQVPFQTDMHSHLLPGIDDGVRTLEDAKATIIALMKHGYTRFITTPHIMSDTYRNSPETILPKLSELRQYLAKEKVHALVDAAAEYYLDDILMEKIERQEPLLTFSGKHLLFETNYMVEPLAMKDFTFKATAQGYRLILAHPERYYFMTTKKASELHDKGILLQLNLLSLSGFYGKPVQRLAEELIDLKIIRFIGTDCHTTLQAEAMGKAIKTKAFKKALDLPLLNASL